MNLHQNVPDIFEQNHDQKLIKRPQASCNKFLKENEILKGKIKNHFFPPFLCVWQFRIHHKKVFWSCKFEWVLWITFEVTIRSFLNQVTVYIKFFLNYKQKSYEGNLTEKRKGIKTWHMKSLHHSCLLRSLVKYQP